MSGTSHNGKLLALGANAAKVTANPMAKTKSQGKAPLTFDLPLSQLGKIEAIRRREKLPTASAAVRAALENFDANAWAVKREAHRQISVRIDSKLRAAFKRLAKGKGASVGEALRAAIDAFAAKSAKTRRKQR